MSQAVLASPGGIKSFGNIGWFLKGAWRGWGKGRMVSECPVNPSALQVEHALAEGAKAAEAVISAVVGSIRPKLATT